MTNTATNKVPTPEEQIKTLEAEIASRGERIQNQYNEIKKLEKELQDERDRRYALWPQRWLKSLLRICLTLIWFALSVGSTVYPLYLGFRYRWRESDGGLITGMLMLGLVFGVLLWCYLHSKEE